MLRGKHITVIISVDGSCSVDAINFIGLACQVATQEIAAALGDRINHQHLKPEARLREQCGHSEREQAR